jgi:hypothetical protein
MSNKFQGEINSYVAGGGNIGRYRFVKETTSALDSTAAIATAGEKPIGVSVEDADQGRTMPVCEEGFGLLVVNGNSVNIAIGDPLKPATGGAGVKAATEGDYYGAVAKEAATADGVIIKVRIERGYLATS